MLSPAQARPMSTPKPVTMAGGMKSASCCTANRVTPTAKTQPVICNPSARPMVGYYGGKSGS